MPPVIRSVDDAALSNVVAASKERLVFVAPGVSESLAQSLAGAWVRLGPERVSVILDADAGACRLGYGTEAGLTLLHDTARRLGTMVCHQPHLRVGVVVNEAETLVFTPTPLLIEAGGESGSGGNAISFPGSPPPPLARDLGIGPNGIADQTIGLDGLTKEMIDDLSQSLKQNPPLPFDVSRYMMVFNAKLEFVEFTVAKIQVQRIDIPIPPELIGLADSNLRTLFRFDPGEDLAGAKRDLEDKKRQLDREYTHPAKGFGGSLFERSRKDEFLKEVKAFEVQLESFREYVKTKFDEVAKRNRTRLYELLLPAVMRQPPARWLKGASAESGQRAALAARLDPELAALFEHTGERLVSEMHVTVLFKGVTYECLTSPEFQEIALRAFPHLKVLHDEFQAAPENNQERAKEP